VTYRIMRWPDRRWNRWHARGTVRRDWLEHRPRLWTFTTVPLSTWLRRPRTGRESYQAHLGPLLLDRELRQMTSHDTEGEQP
jgi:hypothetical protein